MKTKCHQVVEITEKGNRTGDEWAWPVNMTAENIEVGNAYVNCVFRGGVEAHSRQCINADWRQEQLSEVVVHFRGRERRLVVNGELAVMNFNLND